MSNVRKTFNALSPIRVGMLVGSTSVAGGGVIEAVRLLAQALSRNPVISLEIFAPDLGGASQDFGDIPVHRIPVRGPASFAYAPNLVSEMLGRGLDILHVHGLWMYISIAARQWAHSSGKPYIISPHGMLDPWALANNSIKKRLARILYEDSNLRKAACLHALCAAELNAIRAAGFTTPVKVLPNGVDVPSCSAEWAPWRQTLATDAKVLLFLGRVTPKKRVAELVRAFSRVWQPGTPWHLVVVGPVEPDYEAHITGCANSGPARNHIRLIGPAYGDARALAYASADAFILPSISEGLPMAALEAFSHGLPALLTPQCNLPEAFASKAAFEIGSVESAIAAGLRQLFKAEPTELESMSHNALRLSIRAFNWDTIADRMCVLYLSLVGDQRRSVDCRRSLSGRAGLPA